MTKLLLNAIGLFFLLWCLIVIAFPIYKIYSLKTLEMSGDILAIIIIHLVLGAGVVVKMFQQGRTEQTA